MRRSKFTDALIAFVLHQAEEGTSIAELCRKEGINRNLRYRGSKDILKAGRKRLPGDGVREAASDEVKDLGAEARQLNEALAEVTMDNRLLEKSLIADGGEDA